MNQEANEPSLYQRLGGIYPIAAVVDNFIRPDHGRPAPERQSPARRGSPSSLQGGVQVPRHRDGWLGHGRTAKVHRPLDGRDAQAT